MRNLFTIGNNDWDVIKASLKYEQEQSSIDPLIQPLVFLFNRVGLITTSSCQGHLSDRMVSDSYVYPDIWIDPNNKCFQINSLRAVNFAICPMKMAKMKLKPTSFLWRFELNIPELDFSANDFNYVFAPNIPDRFFGEYVPPTEEILFELQNDLGRIFEGICKYYKSELGIELSLNCNRYKHIISESHKNWSIKHKGKRKDSA